MPLGSIPPGVRGLARSDRSYRRGTPLRARAATSGPQPFQPKAALPSIQDVKVIRTPGRASWEFPNGEFLVMVGRGEVHVEVRLGQFIDALLIKTDKE